MNETVNQHNQIPAQEEKDESLGTKEEVHAGLNLYAEEEKTTVVREPTVPQVKADSEQKKEKRGEMITSKGDKNWCFAGDW